MGTIYTIIAPGFEETEAVAVIDLLRRAEIPVKTMGIGGREITGSHAITIHTDMLLKPVDLLPGDGLFLPGGMPGTVNLRENKVVRELIKQAADKGLLVAAICAAPTALKYAGVAKGIRLTSHPSVEQELSDYSYSEDRIVVDGNFHTSRGVGTAVEFGLHLIRVIRGKETADRIKTGILAL